MGDKTKSKVSQEELKKIRFASLYGVFGGKEAEEMNEFIDKLIARLSKVIVENPVKPYQITMTDAELKAILATKPVVSMDVNSLYPVLSGEEILAELVRIRTAKYNRTYAELSTTMDELQKKKEEVCRLLFNIEEGRMREEAQKVALEHLEAKLHTLQAQFDNADKLLLSKQNQCVDLLEECNKLQELLNKADPRTSYLDELEEKASVLTEKNAELYCENQKLKDMIARMRENINFALNTPYEMETCL